MLEIPNLDNQMFREIVDGAVKKIRTVYPQWTDYNEHDPGITILELFAWLKEMEQYYINRMTERSIESLLALLNCRPRPAVPSTASVLFNTSIQTEVFKGQAFYSEGGVVFESLQNEKIGDVFVENVLLNLKGKTVNVREVQLSEGIAFEAFEYDDTKENSFLIGFSFVGGTGLEFYFKLLNNYPIKRNPFESEAFAVRQLRWEYAVQLNDGITYKELKVIKDETGSLSFSGSITFETPFDFGKVSGLGGESKYWIRCVLIKPGCEERPVISRIYGSRVRLIQRETLCENRIFRVEATGKPVNICYGYAKADDNFLVFEKKEDFWRLADVNFTVDSSGLATLSIPGLVSDEIMAVRFSGEISGKSVLRIKGYPGQAKAEFITREGLMDSELSIMVKNEFNAYEVWNYKKYLDEAGPYDKCFSYDWEQGEILFGDNENGEMPPDSENDVIVISCYVTGGKKGIVPENSMLPLSSGKDGTMIKPEIIYSSYGVNKESVHDAKHRFSEKVKKLRKAVTMNDYERIALETPGRRVLCAKAIPCYDDSNPDNYSETAVTVVALPYSGRPGTMPDNEFIRDIQNYLDMHRTVTTKIIVEKPIFVGINIYCETVIGAVYDKEKVKAEIESIIKALFEINSQLDANKIGNVIKESDIIMKISTVEGVFQIARLAVNSDSNNVSRDAHGNISITEIMVPYLKELELHLIA